MCTVSALHESTLPQITVKEVHHMRGQKCVTIIDMPVSYLLPKVGRWKPAVL